MNEKALLFYDRFLEAETYLPDLRRLVNRFASRYTGNPGNPTTN